MDYKDKLRLAKEALDSGSYDKETIEYIFPELAESEDERIRKNLITCISTLKHPFFSERERKEFLAWLEKQAEQKPTDKIEPKFKIGDKVHLINGSSPNYEDDCIVIGDISNDTYYGNWEGGYFAIKDQDKYELVEQNLAEWSEEDEKNINELIRLMEQLRSKYISESHCYPSWGKLVNWLKSLRHQNRWKPSDLQMEALKEACDEHWEPDGLDPLYTLYQDLKKLKE